jgi:hypothetical protein
MSKTINLSTQIQEIISNPYSQIKGVDTRIEKRNLIFNVDFSEQPLNAGRFLALMTDDIFFNKAISDIKVQFEILGQDISIGLLKNFKKKDLLKDDTSKVVIDANVDATFFSATVDTASAQDAQKSVLKLAKTDYVFKDGELIVISNTDSGNITTGKLRINIEYYQNYL